MSATTRKGDGRRLRAEAGRERVAASLVSLVETTGTLPSVAEVAAHAGVARRTVFRYFDGVQALELETARQMREAFAAQLPEPAPHGDLSARLDALVAHRAALYERITPVRRFLDSVRLRGHPDVDAFIDDGRRRLRDNLRELLAAEFNRSPDRLPAAEVVTSWEAWMALREGRRAPPAVAAREVRALLQALFPESVTRRRAHAPATRAPSRRPQGGRGRSAH